MEDNVYKVSDVSRSFFFMIPNIIDDYGLSVFAFRLYCRLKRVAGESGMCNQTTRTIADACKMAVGSVVNAKKELVEAGLISIEVVPGRNGNEHHITINDIWHENMRSYSERSTKQRSPDEPMRSPDERKRSPGGIKEDPLKKTIEEDSRNSCETSQETVIPGEAEKWFEEREQKPQSPAGRKPLTPEEYKERVAAALQRGFENRKSEELETPSQVLDFVNGLPEDIRGVAKAFCSRFGRLPTAKEKPYWIGAWKQQREIGLEQRDIEVGYDKMVDDDLTIKSPQSITAVSESEKRTRASKMTPIVGVVMSEKARQLFGENYGK